MMATELVLNTSYLFGSQQPLSYLVGWDCNFGLGKVPSLEILGDQATGLASNEIVVCCSSARYWLQIFWTLGTPHIW